MKPIVIATDLTHTSENAVRHGMTLARDLGADVVLVHAWEPPAIAVMDATLALPPDQLAVRVGEFQRRLDEVAERFRPEHARLSTRLIEGPAAEAIAKFVQESGARMVVVGTSAPRLLTRLLGSTAEAVVRASPVPVLVVRTQIE
ncbi:MAG: universal stress protein [Polyangiales bacterium]